MSRFGFIGKRLALMLPVVLGVTIITFFLIHLIPGDPARTMLGPKATQEAVAALHQEWGLDRPLPQQYLLFMERLLHGDLGESLVSQIPARQLVASRVPATLLLLAYATVLALAISLPLAVLASLKKDSWLDQSIRAFPLIGLGMPQCWLGVMLILIFAVRLGWFPAGGYGEGLWGHLTSMFLPALTAALATAPILIRSLRASMLDVLQSDYVTTARSKGISERRVMIRHALRNAAIASVAVIAVNIGYLISGTVVIENVFGLPGIGSLMVQAVFSRDFTVVQAATIFYAVVIVLTYLLADMGHAALDPRVRFD